MGSIIIAGIIGFVLGAAIAWAVAVSRREVTPFTSDSGTVVLAKELDSAKIEVTRLHNANALLQSNAAAAEEGRKNAEDNLKSQVALMENAEVRLKEAFAKAANEALTTSSATFLDLADTKFKTLREQASGDLEARKASIDQLVAPIRESLEKVQAQTKAMEDIRIEQTGSLNKELQMISQSHKELQSATMSLVNALKSPKMRGRWGELALRNLVELAGMSSYCDFVEQDSQTNEENHTQRPDMIVRLPGGRQVPVDSKVPLSAFMSAMEAVNDETRTAQLRLHSVHTKDRVRELASKSYWTNLQDAEFVVMFIPNDTFLAVAAEYDPELIQFAIEKKVLIATPSTLMALLKAFAYGWRQDTIVLSAKEVQVLAAELVDRIATFTKHFGDVGNKLEGAVDSYNDALKSWQSRLTPHAEKIKELGAGGIKSIPELELINTIPAQLKEKSSK